MSIDCEDQELLDGFLTETAELLEKLDDDLVSLEKSPEDTELLNGIFRSIHTVKGASSFLGFELLVQLTHKTEDVLNRLRRTELTVTPEIMDVILEAVDLVKLLVGDIKAGEIIERDLHATITKLMPLLSQNAGEANVLKVSEPEVCSDKMMTTAPPASPDEEPPKTEEPLPVAGMSSPPPLAKESIRRSVETAGKTKDQKTDDFGDNSTVRVDVKRLDDLMNQVGELVLERNRMIQLNSVYQGAEDTLIFSDEFSKLSKRLDFVTSELQMQVVKMRMIPVGKIFKKFPRIVRNLARDLGKKVDLQVFGEETELDRSVVDEIGDPLIHLIRNALDHGLEAPDERLAAGKQPVGTVVLSAAHEGNNIVISIKDDGRGIDPERIARKALEKGVVTEEQLGVMGPREILELIFMPGFSTKEKASDMSGRGVGMDVVKTNIKKLNGLIEIRNELGRGSEFILKLPLTLAIIQSLLVEAEGETYSIPLSAVLETLRVEEGGFHTIGGQEVLKLRDSVLPLVRLQKFFGIRQQEKKSGTSYVVIIGAAEKRIGLIVTRLLGQQEIAIKSLGKYLSTVPGVAGSTILGDGRVTLILDPGGLLESAEGKSGRVAA